MKCLPGLRINHQAARDRGPGGCVGCGLRSPPQVAAVPRRVVRFDLNCMWPPSSNT